VQVAQRLLETRLFVLARFMIGLQDIVFLCLMRAALHGLEEEGEQHLCDFVGLRAGLMQQRFECAWQERGEKLQDFFAVFLAVVMVLLNETT
jgi:hypothetical protein